MNKINTTREYKMKNNEIVLICDAENYHFRAWEDNIIYDPEQIGVREVLFGDYKKEMHKRQAPLRRAVNKTKKLLKAENDKVKLNKNRS